MKAAMIAVAALTLASQAWATDSVGQQSIQIRLTQSSPGRDTEQMQYVHQDDPDASFKELVFVDREVVADQDQIRSAKAVPYGDGQARVDVFLNTSKNKAARRKAGSHVAVIVGGQLCGVGKVAAESTSDKLELSGDFTPAQAQALADRINEAARQQ